MGDVPIIQILIVAFVMTGVTILVRERWPYRKARFFDGEDVRQINRVIATSLPGGERAKYLDAPDRWWFVGWSEEEADYKHAVSLDLSGAGLKGELEISGLTELVRLDCGDNELTSLKLSRLPKLTTLNCRSNRLVSLDLSKLPRLTHLDCEDNRLMAITLPRRRSDMTCLYCSGDSPPVMVLPKRVKLRTFCCGSNPLAIIDPPRRSRLIHPAPPKRPMEEVREQAVPPET